LRRGDPRWQILQSSRTHSVEETAALRPCCRRRRTIRLKARESNPCWSSASLRSGLLHSSRGFGETDFARG
jgi:hypothetical protein